ncbi:mCG146315, partial [Mus musculus]
HRSPIPTATGTKAREKERAGRRAKRRERSREEIFTFPPHAHFEALLEAAVLALVAVVLVDGTVPVGTACVAMEWCSRLLQMVSIVLLNAPCLCLQEELKALCMAIAVT